MTRLEPTTKSATIMIADPIGEAISALPAKSERGASIELIEGPPLTAVEVLLETVIG
jgi:hypothetical protein